MPRQSSGHGLWRSLPEPGAALNVGEQVGHRAGRLSAITFQVSLSDARVAGAAASMDSRDCAAGVGSTVLAHGELSSRCCTIEMIEGEDERKRT